MKKIILLSMLFFSLIVFCQNNKKIDSLLVSLQRGSEKQKFLTLINIADVYSNFDLDKAILYSNKSLLKAKKMQNDSLIGLAYNSIANNFQYKSVIDSALKYHNKALDIRIKIKDSIGIADSHNNLGIVYDTKGDFPSAIKNYFKALFLYEKRMNIEKQAMVYGNIGIVYKEEKEYKKALTYYQNSYDLFLKTTDKLSTIVTAGNLGSIFINLKQYNESLKYSNIAKEGYLKLGYSRFLGYPIANIAYVNDSLHKFKIASENYLKAIDFQEKAENNYEVAEVTAAYSSCLLKQNMYKESIDYSFKSMQFAQKSDAILLKILSYKNLYRAYSKTGNYREALKYSELFISGNDSIFQKEKSKDIEELETKYQTAKKEQIIKNKDAEVKQQNLYFIIATLLGFIAIGIGYFFFKQQKTKNKQQKQESALKETLLKIESENQLQEQRLGISKELHDNIGSQLTFVISSIDTLKQNYPNTNEKIGTQLENINAFTKNTITELRDTVWVMNTKDINGDALKERLLDNMERAKTTYENINFKIDIESFKIENSVVALNLFRTIQEAVNNALKYANATELEISIQEKNNQIVAFVRDNGQGFDLETIKKGNGLKNMKKRIKSVGGTFNMTSQEKIGTYIDIIIAV